MPLDLQALIAQARAIPAPTGAPAQPWVGEMPDPEAPVPGSLIVQTDDDGGVTVKIAGHEQASSPSDFDANLADDPRLATALAAIATDILTGIEDDIASRQQMLANYAEGLDLLGLQIESRGKTKAQKRNISRVRDSTLLESVVKAQSLARGELLPASGPAKVVTAGFGAAAQTDQLAAAFEADLNQALTVGMPEYVPEMDRGLFLLFYGGNLFRKGYHDPVKGRPAVATIAVEDLIVSEEATDLDTAIRVTHRIPAMSPADVKRRQLAGVWRDCDLGVPTPEADPTKHKLREIAGQQPMYTRAKDMPFVIYETITDLDLSDYGLNEDRQPDGLPLPYVVTVEHHSRQVLRIARYWREDDPQFRRKRRIVHYAMVPGFGLLAYGLLHLQGNQVKALTATLRLMLDSLMFSIFPGGVKVKGARTDTNEIEPGPGEWVDIGVPGGMDDIRKALMALPYKDLSPVAIQLYEAVQQAAARMGSAAELEVGEGRANVPVGTIMAILEEKTQVMAAVHKRLHAAQAQELLMIRELFAEDPASLARVLPKPSREWQVAAEFADLDLVPASDPNVPSQTHRLMKATALATLSAMPQFAPIMNMQDVLERILSAIGVADVDSVVQSPPPTPPDPAAGAAQATLAAKQMDVQAKQQDNERKAAAEAVQAQQRAQQTQLQARVAGAKQQSDERIAAMHEQTERIKLAAEEARSRRQEAAQAVTGAAERALQQQQQSQQREMAATQLRARQKQDAAPGPAEGAPPPGFGSNSI